MPLRAHPDLSFGPFGEGAKLLNLGMRCRLLVGQRQAAWVEDANLAAEVLQQPPRLLREKAAVGRLPQGPVEDEDARAVGGCLGAQGLEVGYPKVFGNRCGQFIHFSLHAVFLATRGRWRDRRQKQDDPCDAHIYLCSQISTNKDILRCNITNRAKTLFLASLYDGRRDWRASQGAMASPCCNWSSI